MREPRNEREFALANVAPPVPRPDARRRRARRLGAVRGLLARAVAVALGVAGAAALLVAGLLGRL